MLQVLAIRNRKLLTNSLTRTSLMDLFQKWRRGKTKRSISILLSVKEMRMLSLEEGNRLTLPLIRLPLSLVNLVIWKACQTIRMTATPTRLWLTIPRNRLQQNSLLSRKKILAIISTVNLFPTNKLNGTILTDGAILHLNTIYR